MQESLNPKELQLNMDVFLEAEAPAFVADLWKLLLSAQASPGGIPAEFLEQKKAELRQKRVRPFLDDLATVVRFPFLGPFY